MTAQYQVVARGDSRKLAEFLSKEGQLPLPVVDLITEAKMAVDELIDAAGRATIEAILLMSADQNNGVGTESHCRPLWTLRGQTSPGRKAIMERSSALLRLLARSYNVVGLPWPMIFMALLGLGPYRSQGGLLL